MKYITKVWKWIKQACKKIWTWTKKACQKTWVWLKKTIHKFLNWFDSLMTPAPIAKKRGRPRKK